MKINCFMKILQLKWASTRYNCFNAVRNCMSLHTTGKLRTFPNTLVKYLYAIIILFVGDLCFIRLLQTKTGLLTHHNLLKHHTRDPMGLRCGSLMSLSSAVISRKFVNKLSSYHADRQTDRHADRQRSIISSIYLREIKN